MATLKGIHKGPMTVKLVCGGIIEGIRNVDGMLISDARRDVNWHFDGKFYFDGPSVLDIAEVTSKPPQATMKELHDAGELEVGMRFRCGRSGYVWTTSKTTGGLWLFSSAGGPMFYAIDGIGEPSQMILQGEDNV